MYQFKFGFKLATVCNLLLTEVLSLFTGMSTNTVSGPDITVASAALAQEEAKVLIEQNKKMGKTMPNILYRNNINKIFLKFLKLEKNS